MILVPYPLDKVIQPLNLVLAFKCVNGLAPDYLGIYCVKRSAVHNKYTRDVTILWSSDVDCQWDKGHFTFGVQGNGMG